MMKMTLSNPAGLGLAAALLLALGAAGGAGAVAATRPAVQMAPLVRTDIARLPASTGIVTVKGQVAEVFGDRLVLQDASGRTMIDAGRAARGTIAAGTMLTVQGRYDDGQLRAAFLVDPAGKVGAVGPGPRGPGGHDGKEPGPHGPRMAGGPDAPPPPPAGCAPGEATPPPPVAQPDAGTGQRR